MGGGGGCKAAPVSDTCIVGIVGEVEDVVSAGVVGARAVNALHTHQRDSTPMQACGLALDVIEVVEYLELIIA